MPVGRQLPQSGQASRLWPSGGMHLWPSGGTSAADSHPRGHLVYAARGVLSVHTERGASIVPANRVAWTPAGFTHYHRAHGQTDLPANFFHFVFTHYVLEHVADIEAVTREIARVTAPGGCGFHVYPGQLRPIEPHLFMPFVHWLPKNVTRKWAIAAFVACGIEPRWGWLAAAPVGEKAEAYYQFCNRLAVLHVLNGARTPARLLFVYFHGDTGDARRTCPASAAAWDVPLAELHRHVGLPATHPLCDRIHSCRIDVHCRAE